MRLKPILLALLWSFPAFAHLHLDSPASFYTQNTTGDPQKAPIGVFAPCGVNIDGGVPTGAPSGLVTDVTVGQSLTLTWHDTVQHPGTFRIGIARRQTDFAEATTDGTCSSTSIEATPTYPVVADGILSHSGTSPDGGGWDYTITVPNLVCDAGPCVMQLVQFMLGHGAPGGSTCYYHHCAALRILPPDAGGTGGGAGGAGGTGGSGGGTGGGTATGGGSGGTGGSGGGTGTGGGTATGGGSGGTGGTGGGAGGAGGGTDAQGGCSCDTTSATALMSLLVLWGALSRRRRT